MVGTHVPKGFVEAQKKTCLELSATELKALQGLERRADIPPARRDLIRAMCRPRCAKLSTWHACYDAKALKNIPKHEKAKLRSLLTSYTLFKYMHPEGAAAAEGAIAGRELVVEEEVVEEVVGVAANGDPNGETVGESGGSAINRFMAGLTAGEAEEAEEETGTEGSSADGSDSAENSESPPDTPPASYALIRKRARTQCLSPSPAAKRPSA